MFYRLTLPNYEVIKEYEGKGNHAVSKYYKFPFAYFYQKKLKLILREMRVRYKNIMDFGAGPGIFVPELKKRSSSVLAYEPEQLIDPRWKFDLIVCASVLEFCELPHTLLVIRSMMTKDSEMIVSSPMDSWITRLYFWLIGDKTLRHSHTLIHNHIDRYFHVETYKKWFGIYFVIRAKL